MLLVEDSPDDAELPPAPPESPGAVAAAPEKKEENVEAEH